MRLSILIPVFNFSVEMILAALVKEVDDFSLCDDVELVFVDDCSTMVMIKNKNRQLISKYGKHVKIIELDRNIGRSSVRNLLVKSSSGEYLLFLDVDTMPSSKNFLRSYLDAISREAGEVVCGGVDYFNDPGLSKEFKFCVYAGKRREAVPAHVRKLSPWQYVLSSNVVVKRSVFLACPFDERFIGYGYEDSDWGVRLHKSYNVVHIDNSVYHMGLSTKWDMMNKMKGSIGNYCLFAMLHPSYFKNTRVAGYFSLLERVDETVLRKLDYFLEWVYFSTPIMFLSYLVFQLDKAVLLALECRRSKP